MEKIMIDRTVEGKLPLGFEFFIVYFSVAGTA